MSEPKEIEVQAVADIGNLLAHIDAIESRECAPCEEWKKSISYKSRFAEEWKRCPWCEGKIKQ